ncbi:uncharacterized protein DFL_000107 [Arthrobotrys flagrans]|uniref:Uncharacterized protein n=1 Tax=Arthrobotrys flagrans TaxID=97331 RepID=A0A437ACT5_ARTFL|nr:hypothetical protein DFL_000107 [Arthrobotrys flagrans]
MDNWERSPESSGDEGLPSQDSSDPTYFRLPNISRSRRSDPTVLESEICATDSASDSDSDAGKPNIPYIYGSTRDDYIHERENFFFMQRQKPWRGNHFLHYYVSKNAFVKLARARRIRSPRNLKYFKMEPMESDPFFFCLPLISCRTITALYIEAGNGKAIKDPKRLEKDLRFPSIKALEISFERYSGIHELDSLAIQFPNLTSLAIVFGRCWTHWLLLVPNLPYLEYLQVPWSSESSDDPITINEILEQHTQRLKNGDFPVLKTLKVSGYRAEDTSSVSGDPCPYGVATCIISRPVDADGQITRLKCEWVKDLDGVEEPKATYLDGLWNSGNFVNNTEPLDGEIEEPEELESDIERLETDESIFDSEEERIDLDRRRKIRMVKKDRAGEKRQKILSEERR